MVKSTPFFIFGDTHKKVDMKKLEIVLYLLLQVILSYGQTPCDSSAVASDLDNPPGCNTCGFPFETNNFTATPDTFDYDFACGTIENSIWIAVFTDFQGEIKLSINGKVCTTPEKGFEVGLYDSNLNKIGGCSSTTGITSPLQVQYHSLIPGEYYWMMIDGKNGARCSFTVERSKNEYSDLAVFSSEARNSNCPGVEICYYSQITTAIDQYDWSINPFAEIVSGGDLQDSFVCFQFDLEETYLINLEVTGFCFQTGNANYVQEITEDFYIDGMEFRLDLCSGDFPFTTDHGVVNEFGDYEFILTSASGCDSVIRYKIVEYRFFDFIDHFICLSELPFTTRHGVIDKFGVHDFTVTSANGCDSLFRYRVNENFATIPEFDTISLCNDDFVVVDSQIISNSGNHFFFYEDGSKKGCDSSYQLTLNVIDTIAPEINCFYDSIVQKVGIKWTSKANVLGYDLKINDDSIRLGNRFTYLFSPTEPNQVLDISVKPFSDICTHPTAFAQCIGPSEIVVQAGNISESSKIELFPNPTSGLINIKSEIPIENIEAFDFSGRKILIDDFSKIDLSDEPSGVYIFKIKTSEGVVLKRTLKL